MQQKILFLLTVRRMLSGVDPGVFLEGGALVSCSTSTPINHIVFFFLQNTSCIRKPQVISGEGAHPLHPPPRSAPEKATKVKCKREESLTKQSIFVEYSLLQKKHLSFAGARGQINTTLYQNRPEDTQNQTNLYLELHDYQIYYVNIDLRLVISMEFLSLSRRRSSTQNVLSDEEGGETDVFAGY